MLAVVTPISPYIEHKDRYTNVAGNKGAYVCGKFHSYRHIWVTALPNLITDDFHDSLQDVAAKCVVEHHGGKVATDSFGYAPVLSCVILHADEHVDFHPGGLKKNARDDI